MSSTSDSTIVRSSSRSVCSGDGNSYGNGTVALSRWASMRALLSTIGSRGDVQPLALQLRVFGHDVHLCAPPDFRERIEELGFAFTPIGPELRRLTAAVPSTP